MYKWFKCFIEAMLFMTGGLIIGFSVSYGLLWVVVKKPVSMIALLVLVFVLALTVVFHAKEDENAVDRTG